MLTANDIISLHALGEAAAPLRLPSPHAADAPSVAAGTPASEILPVLLESPAGVVTVRDDEGLPVGELDFKDMLEAFQLMFASSRDCSWVELRMPAADYSASAIARAVEDADASLLDILAQEDRRDPAHLLVSLRVDHLDPSGVVRSLERYGYTVRSTYGARYSADSELVSERISNLKLYLNI